MNPTPSLLAALVVVLAFLVAPSCGQSGGDTKPSEDIPPVREPDSTVDNSPQRRVRRLSADQFHSSLQVATGQSYSAYETFAGALGRADFGAITNEGKDITVTFDKLVHDAARETCRAAVVDDDDKSTEAIVLRHVSSSDRATAALTKNLKYLFMRFLAVQIDRDDDERLAPWLGLLQSDAAGAPSDDEMKLRWAAVCVGLVTHPDFLTY